MSVFIQAALSLEPGCKLIYNCPHGPNPFFDTHHGKIAIFLSYVESLVGPLDYTGRKPGRYIERERIKVQFEGEGPEELNIHHFTVIDITKAKLIGNPEKDHCLGELPHPVLFYPGDSVSFKRKPDERFSDDPKFIRDIYLGHPFTVDSVPRYAVWEHSDYWNASGENLELIKRGNVWALYNDPSKLAFDSDKSELAFWGRDGISRLSGIENAESLMVRVISTTNKKTLKEAWRRFTRFEADLIIRDARDHERYETRKIHDCFAEFRSRVRDLTAKAWKNHAEEEAIV